MTIINRKIELLIREIDPSDKNGRYLRENLRRIKEFLDALVDGGVGVGYSSTSFTTSSSPDSFNRYESYFVTSNGQVAFVLANTPANPSKVVMAVNGQEMTNGVHFTVVGKNVTFLPVAAGFILEVSNEFGEPDLVVFKYMV